MRRAVLFHGRSDLSLERLLPVGFSGRRRRGGLSLLTRIGRGRVLVIGDFDADGATSTA